MKPNINDSFSIDQEEDLISKNNNDKDTEQFKFESEFSIERFLQMSQEIRQLKNQIKY